MINSLSRAIGVLNHEDSNRGMVNTSSSVKKARKLFENHIYRGPVKTTIQRSGLNRVLAYLYDKSISVSYWIDSRRGDTIYTVDLGRLSADYHMSSGKERDFLPRFASENTEGEILKVVIQELTPGDVFYDIGSNVGQYACFAAQKIDPQDVHCFEPHPKSAARLRENLALNDVDATVHEVALSGSDGVVHFDLGEDMEGGMGRITDTNSERAVSVPSRSVDSFRADKGVSPPDIVKMDVDGVEWELVPGMKETLQNSACRLIMMEVHPRQIEERGGSVERLIGVLEESGFVGERMKSHKDSNSFHMKFERAQ